ncbi:hypothetical protein FEM48_Zijuj11G0138100 [Ziziphus jujuba var. spinosa]|uniref:Rx N-terminal domain-containing protein n=1 Tax=Ziziphus jujuba var. spinosa TaxID=714518 RepID=A0A978UJA7_ZIZJJ|nr:hypothetical protein FEM48_Zijuj11G0138100 [Ziziphus jujuba var. spinosa]
MAEAFVKAMLDNLNSLIQKEFGLLWGFDKEMEKLSSTLSTISAVLEDAEEKQFRDRPIKNWLRKLRDASYELDDILDECATEASRMEYEGQRSRSTQKDESMDGGSPVKSSSRRVRHMLCTYSARPFDNISNAQSTLRTFMTAHQLGVSNEKWPKFSYDLNDFPSLRAFSIEKCQFSPSISSILSYHKHLRYLNLSGTDIRILPTAICSLPNLQTLDLAHCHKLQKLPKHISRLTSLRHLDIYHCCSLSHTPPNIGRLTCLKTLSTFIVDEKRGHHLDELQGLNLGGDLQIQDLQKVRTSMDAKRTNLISKKDLDSLSLCWGENDPQSPQKAEHVLEALEPPPNLSYLLIHSYEGFCFPRWFDIGILENIVNLTLARCKNISLLPPSLRKLPSLKSLEISGMISVRYLDHESYDGTSMRSFMSLRSLTMKALPNLEKSSREEGREMFPCLTSLNIEKCPKLTLPSLPSIKNLYIGECNEVLLKSIPNFSALTWLSLSDNDQMTSFPDGMLQNLNSLKSLKISRFTKLQELCFDILISLGSLESLLIMSCYELRCFQMGVLRGSISLKTIRIINCIKFKSYYTSSIVFTELQSLRLFGGLSELKSDPNGFKNLPSLRSLYLSGCNFAWNWKDYPCSKIAA